MNPTSDRDRPDSPDELASRREFLLRLARGAAYAAPVMYSVSLSAIPAAAMSGPGSSGNCPPGYYKKEGKCVPINQPSLAPTGGPTAAPPPPGRPPRPVWEGDPKAVWKQ